MIKSTALETIKKIWAGLRFFRFFPTKPVVHSFDFWRFCPFDKPKSFDLWRFLFDDFPPLFDGWPLMLQNQPKLRNKVFFQFLSTLFRFICHSYSIPVHFTPEYVVRFRPLLFDDWRIAVRFSVIYAFKNSTDKR